MKTNKRQKVSSSEEEFDPNQKGEDYDLFMDNEEREKFDKMTEKEREIEIYKRLEQREIMKTREKIKKKLEMAAGKKADEEGSSSQKKRKRKISEESNEGNDDDKEDSPSEAGEVDSSSDEPKESSSSKGAVKAEPDESDGEIDADYHKPSEVASKQSKKKAMAELLSKRRNKRQTEEKRRKETLKATLDLDEVFGNEDDEGKSASSSSSSVSSSRSSSPDLGKSRSPSPVAKQEIHGRDELIRCQLFRRKLAKFVHAPFFAKTVVGCFVRISIGPNKLDGKQVYRAAQVVEVVETAKIYEVEPNSDIRTNKGFRLKVCDGEPMRVYRLEFISNSHIVESEFLFWLNKLRSTNTPVPTVDFVDRKRKEILDALTYNYSESEVNLLIKEKQRFKRQPTNFAFQKAELLKTKVGG
uniref:Plus3 domain-containing protein n=1 Tax=Globodera rostochiensis TaxID=31243 RepID=A0A914HIB6_GLORO